MQPPLRPERAHDYSSAKYPQLDNPQLGLLLTSVYKCSMRLTIHYSIE
nr:hypothetical protein [Nostoc sp. ChiSLP03a]